ncbi:HD domain-containing protein [Ectobacillus sp. JY-23]|uniref:HD domain-containing protein n=1 Tax=Ectobacillus sp. JY-23 TaxID=2933872 RepID=UPI001FF4799B|nr:HD domain-containing protein [Ectobacillus sp. JY-23]UOY92759.1 HD domain-containing protein [Ectobacillus sp. JY-23]
MERCTLDRWMKAVEMATVAHMEQARKGNGVPYITHPYTVALLLTHAGCREEVIIAGLLHDTIEDTTIRYEDIRKEFGDVVAELVLECTELDRTKSWEERKQQTIEKLSRISMDACMIACADKLHNIRGTAQEFSICGEEIWKRFNRGKDKQQWYYTSVVGALGKRIPNTEIYQLLKAEVERLFNIKI